MGDTWEIALPRLRDNAPAGRSKQRDAGHRTQAYVEDRIKELEGLRDDPATVHFVRPQQCLLQLTAHAVNVLASLRTLALKATSRSPSPSTALPDAVRVAPYVRHSRFQVLKAPRDWSWWPTTSPTPSTACARCTPTDRRAPVHPPPQQAEQ